MTRAKKILQLAEKQMTTYQAVNIVIKAVKGWGGFTVGAIPLSKELGMNPKSIDNILLQLSKRSFLKKRSDEVYQITPLMQNVEGIDPSGKLLLKKGYADMKRDPWAANFGR